MNISDFSQKPVSGRTYAKNEVPAFVITTQSTLLAVLTIGNETVFQGSYSPDFSGQISIDFKGLYDEYLETLIPSSAGNTITHTAYRRQFTATFYVLIGEDTAGEPATLSWYVANALLNSSSSFQNWSSRNFLTNMPLEKVTNYESPEWLTWLDLTGASRLDVRFYPKTGGNLDATVCTMSSEGCFSANVRYSRLIQMAHVMTSSLKGYYDLILYDTKSEEVCRQRYIYEERSGREKYFCFVNALGGIDTLICDGENVLQPETTHNIGRFADRYRALDDTDDQRKWTQNTGMMPTKYRNWVYELLTAKQGAQKYDPAAMDYYEIVVATSEIGMTDFGELAEASFDYILDETVNVMLDTERAVDRSLHQSVADEAEEMEDLTKKAVLSFSSDGQGGYETNILNIEATSFFLIFVKSSSSRNVYIYLDGVERGIFNPYTDSSPMSVPFGPKQTLQLKTSASDQEPITIQYYGQNLEA